MRRDALLNLAQLMTELVVSGDRIGAYHAQAGEAELDRALGAYLREIDFFRRAARGRRDLFEALWPDAPAEEDDAIEAELKPEYWRPPG